MVVRGMALNVHAVHVHSPSSVAWDTMRAASVAAVCGVLLVVPVCQVHVVDRVFPVEPIADATAV